ncbi:secreted protein [Favolaschia claudopus]|uniref:Secreted protein n=1 Tax=Favolaschia claudopus TaxID=2862362 RepID=A0AAW0D1W1_9AGAR
MLPVFYWLVCAALLVLPAFGAPRRHEFYDPRILGGRMLNNVTRRGGEPLNVIISGLSAPSVLTTPGFLNFANSLGLCSYVSYPRRHSMKHSGSPQPANLGDGNGWVHEMMVLRESYGSAALGTCLETFIGTVYRQDGPEANSGALFLAVSQEENLFWHHTISRDGYNIGRDLLVNQATRRTTSYKGVRYITTARPIYDLMTPGKLGCALPFLPFLQSKFYILPAELITVYITIDGTVVLLTVNVELSIESFVSRQFKLVADYFSMLFFVHTTYCMQNIWTIW